MSMRMSKYYGEEEVKLPNTRTKRNEYLYREINKAELNNFDIKSNATVLGDNENEINVEQIKKILDTKYKEAPRKTIKLDVEEEVTIEKEDTKEYDLNIILEKAKEEHQDNYNEERFKKLRDTQFDILNNLDINKESEEKGNDLESLLNTISKNEKNVKSNKFINENDDPNPLDILSDLKGSGKTEVMQGFKEEIEEVEKDEKDLTNSFYTQSNKLSDKDFEELDDFSDIESNNKFIKILIPIIVIIFLVGVFLVIKTLYFK